VLRPIIVIAASLSLPARAYAAGPIVAVPSGDLSLWEGLSAIALGAIVAVALRAVRRRRAKPEKQQSDDDHTVAIEGAVQQGTKTDELLAQLALLGDASSLIDVLERIETMQVTETTREACVRAIACALAQMRPLPLPDVQRAMRTRRHLPQLCGALALRDMELGQMRSYDLADMWLENAADKLAAIGDRDGAIRLYALQERVAEDEASWATGGGEGMSAADTMRRCRKKIDRLLAAQS
jgi:hypothetical protein